MSDPQTTNILLNVPSRGSDSGTWDVPLNGNSSAIDGLFGGKQIIIVSSSPIALTSPTGTPTPSGGPTQAQNSVLTFTGSMSSNVQVTLPLPIGYQVENLTTGNFVLSFRAAGTGEVIAIDQGVSERIYCDGTNVKFSELGAVGRTEIWAGLSAMPGWVAACTVPPYLLCDGSVYNFATYPYLGKRLGGSFGGNGITTFGVPDLRGRQPIPYDGTGTRITASGCGINGQTIGAAGGSQNETLLTANLPPYTPAGSVASAIQYGGGLQNGSAIITPGGNVGVGGAATGGTTLALNTNLLVTSTFTGSAQGGSSAPVTTVQPSQVTGIAVIRAA